MFPLDTARPLAGITVLITRAKSQAASLAEQVEALGGQVWECPVITIDPPESWVPLDAALANLEGYRWLVVTSQSGAEAFASRLGGRSLTRLRVAAVGTATAQALDRLGITVDLIPSEYRGAALPAALAPRLQPGDRVLMPRGDLADAALPDALRQLGAVVDEVVAYRTIPARGDISELKRALAGGRIHYVTFTSGSTIVNLIERLGDAALLRQSRIACIGPQTRRAAEEAGLPVQIVPARATALDLVAAIATDARANHKGGTQRS